MKGKREGRGGRGEGGGDGGGIVHLKKKLHGLSTTL